MQRGLKLSKIIDGELRDQQEDGEKATDEMDAERSTSAIANSNEGSEQRI